jgi:hypothetical protein
MAHGELAIVRACRVPIKKILDRQEGAAGGRGWRAPCRR